MELWTITILLFGALLLLLILGLPVAFTLAGLAILFTFYLFGPQALPTIAYEAYGAGSDFVLICVPLFVLMANILERTGLASDLYKMMYMWLCRIPGGLASGTTVICAIFAAMVGISAVGTITMGMIALPSMLERNYDKRLIVGNIMAGGALGILIPPSLIGVLYGSITGTSVGKLFMGGVIPGILLTFLIILYITVRCLIQPKLAPPVKERFTWHEKIASLKSLISPLILIGVILGTLYTGVCTPTESASLGAVGTIILAVMYRKFNWKIIKTVISRTVIISSMAVWIVFGAACFKGLYISTGASNLMGSFVSGVGIAPMGIIGIMMFIYLILGCLMDPVGILMLTMPVFAPIIESLGYDHVWFGILFIITSEMGYLTPPFGFNLFYMRAIVPPSITMNDIYMSVTPFVVLQAICLVLVMFFPQLALWLPSTM